MLKCFARLATLFLLALSCAQAQGQSASVEGAGRAARSADGPMIVTPRVKMALGAVQRLEGANIDVDTMGGRTRTVTLLGRVRDLEQKKLAGDIAHINAPGYKIINRLRTDGELETHNPGAAASTVSEVKDALGRSRALAGSNIDVKGGTGAGARSITLSGVEGSEMQKSIAASIARRSAPGFIINNRLRVARKARAGQMPDAANVTIAIKVALVQDLALRGTSIDVDTGPSGGKRGGLRVTLRGTVRTRAQKLRALYIARQEAPGLSIINRLSVAPAGSR